MRVRVRMQWLACTSQRTIGGISLSSSTMGLTGVEFGCNIWLQALSLSKPSSRPRGGCVARDGRADQPLPTGGAAPPRQAPTRGGAHPRRRAREASRRACAECGRQSSLYPTPSCRGPSEKCVTRRERGGHLRLLGASAGRLGGRRRAPRKRTHDGLR